MKTRNPISDHQLEISSATRKMIQDAKTKLDITIPITKIFLWMVLFSNPNELESKDKNRQTEQWCKMKIKYTDRRSSAKQIRYSSLHNTESLQAKDQAEDQTDKNTTRALKKLNFIFNRDLKPPRVYTWKETKEQGGGEVRYIQREGINFEKSSEITIIPEII